MATIDQYKIVVDVQGEQAVNRLKNSIGGLGTALTGLAFGAFTAGIFRMADAASDLADATGLAAGEVQAFQNAMALAGGDADNAGKALIQFYKTLEEGASDQTSKAAEALAKLGIGLNELRTLSEGELLAKALEELGGMKAGADRTALAMEAFGKSFGMIDPKRFQEILKTQDVQALQDELQRIGQINDNIQGSFMQLQMAGLNALSAILGPIEDFKLSADQAEKLIKILGAGIAIAFSASVVRNVITLVSAVSALSKALRITAIAQAAVVALTGPAGWAVLAGAAVAAGAAIYGIDKALGDANKETIALGNSAKKTFGQMNAGKGGAFKGATGVTEQQTDARKKEALAAQQVTDQMRLQNDEANKLRQKSIDLIGVDSDRANLIKSNAQVESDGRKQVADLEAKIVAERAKGKGTNQEVIAQLQEQKNVVNGQVAEATRLNEVEYQRLQQLRLQQSALKSQLAFVDFTVQQLQALDEKQIRDALLLGQIGKEEYDRKMTLHDAETKHLSDVSKLNAQIKDEQKKAIPDPTKIQEYKNEVDNLNLAWIQTQGILTANNKTIDAINKSQAAGARAALDNIGKQFEDYRMAQDAVTMGWSKVNDALDTFIQTGKFNFKDFASSIIGMLAKMVAQAMIFKYIFEPIMGALGLSSGTSAPVPIPGLATGGPAKAGKPYVVGEQGPELFVPKSAGSVIPNNKLPSKAEATGTGMVNAPITNNYITNNIQAVDAKSVAQLFAENRKTLLGSVEMARRELPYQMA